MARFGRMQVCIVGIALFSMFFGGGNLTFPLWCGIQTGSPLSTILGFLLSGVMVPFYGILVSLSFKGDYEKLLSVWGKPIGQLLIFFLLLFWIPLGSGPRCNQLAYGAYSQVWGTIPLWLHSAIYSIVIYFLTFRKNRILDILGNLITPALLISLVSFIWLGINNMRPDNIKEQQKSWAEFLNAFSVGYYTMDFIAAIFFTPTIIALIKAKKKDQYTIKFVFSACILALVLLSSAYVGMIIVGNVNWVLLNEVPRNQLLAALGKTMFAEKYHLLMFIVITLSCMTTSVALALVFSDYLRITVFKGRIEYKKCLAISILISFGFSVIGFESLAILISYAMSVFYPFLLVTTMASLVKKLYQKKFGSYAPEL